MLPGIGACSTSCSHPQPGLQAQVQYVEGGSAAEQLTIAVRLPNGQVINLDGGSTAAGKTIDVEWREIE